LELDRALGAGLERQRRRAGRESEHQRPGFTLGPKRAVAAAQFGALEHQVLAVGCRAERGGSAAGTDADAAVAVAAAIDE
jgi:hypothetical protein